jgi:hypothetical protein
MERSVKLYQDKEHSVFHGACNVVINIARSEPALIPKLLTAVKPIVDSISAGVDDDSRDGSAEAAAEAMSCLTAHTDHERVFLDCGVSEVLIRHLSTSKAAQLARVVAQTVAKAGRMFHCQLMRDGIVQPLSQQCNRALSAVTVDGQTPAADGSERERDGLAWTALLEDTVHAMLVLAEGTVLATPFA